MNGMENPLVSVVIITYNSAKYVVEALESIKEQTYQNIELIVSDDCSPDNTVEICRKWIEENKERFVRTELVTAPKNTGIAGNANRGWKVAKGEWVKVLAGDDKFLPVSIEMYVQFVTEHPDCRICYAKPKIEDEEGNTVECACFRDAYWHYLKKDWKAQFKRIHTHLFVPGPGLFVKKSLYDESRGYDERYPFCEEYAFTYNILKLGNRIFFVDKELYVYVIRSGSLSHDNGKLNYRVFKDFYQYFLDERRKNMVKHGFWLHAWNESVQLYYQSQTYRTDISPFGMKLRKLVLLLSPVTYVYIFRNLLSILK